MKGKEETTNKTNTPETPHSVDTLEAAAQPAPATTAVSAAAPEPAAATFAPSSTTQKQGMNPRTRQMLIYGGIAVIICCVSFVAGMEVQKNRASNDRFGRGGMMGRFNDGDEWGTSNGGFGGGMNNMGGGLGRPEAISSAMFGNVTKVSDTSITISNGRRGTTSTFTITTDTVVRNGNAKASVGDIKVGNNVLVEANGDDATTATTIQIGMPGRPSSSSSSTDDATLQTQTN